MKSLRIVSKNKKSVQLCVFRKVWKILLNSLYLIKSTLVNHQIITQQSKQKNAPKGGLKPSKTILWFSVFECSSRADSFRKTKLQFRHILNPDVVRFGGGGGSIRLLFVSVGVVIFLNKIKFVFQTIFETWFRILSLDWIFVKATGISTVFLGMIKYRKVVRARSFYWPTIL